MEAPKKNTAVMARRRRRRRPGGHTTAVGSGGRRAPISTDTASHTHTARSIACPLLTLSSARPFSNGIFRPDGATASLSRASSSLTHTQDGWFLQPERRPAGLPRRILFSRCICRCSRMRARLSSPRVLLPHTCTQDGCGCRASAGRLRPGNGDQPEALYALALIH